MAVERCCAARESIADLGGRDEEVVKGLIDRLCKCDYLEGNNGGRRRKNEGGLGEGERDKSGFRGKGVIRTESVCEGKCKTTISSTLDARGLGMRATLSTKLRTEFLITQLEDRRQRQVSMCLPTLSLSAALGSNIYI